MNLRWACFALLLAGAGLCAVAQADQVYRWVDAQGNVHYSQTPPPGAVTKAKLVDVEPPPPDATGVQQQQKLVTSVNTAAAAQQTAAAKAQQEAEKKTQQQQRCDAARKQLQDYMETHRVIANGNSANPTYYSGDDLVKFRQQAQEQVNKVCGSG